MWNERLAAQWIASPRLAGPPCDNARGGVGQTVASFAAISVVADAEESPGSTGHGAR